MLKLSVIQLSLLLGAQCHTASALLWTPVGLPPGRGSGRCPQARALTVMPFLIWEQGGVYKVSELLELHETFLCFFSPLGKHLFSCYHDCKWTRNPPKAETPDLKTRLTSVHLGRHLLHTFL